MAKIKCPEGVPEWILTYGDMMSLLLCFFIMLYAISTLEVVKIDAVVESLEAAFGTKGKSVEPRNLEAPSAGTTVSQAEKDRRQYQTRGGQTVKSPIGDQPRIISLRSQGDPVKGSIITFGINSDALDDAAKTALKSVVSLLGNSSYMIAIEGHASPRERDGNYTAQCDLAFARAMEARRQLIEFGIPENILVVQVVGPYAPVAAAASTNTDPITRNAIVQIVQLTGIASQ